MIRIRSAALALTLALGVSAVPAGAFVLEMPAAAAVIGGRAASPGSYSLPIGPYSGAAVPVRRIEGALDQRAYRLESQALTTMQLLQPLRGQLTAAGYAVIFECDTTDCGGFDFRYGMAVLPEPQMHVDLGDFRYLAAQNGASFVGLLVSRSADQGFVQVTSVNASGQVAPVVDQGGDSGQTAASGQGSQAVPLAPVLPVIESVPPVDQIAIDPVTGGLGARLEQQGALALDDLIFASGKAALADKDYASLAELAEWLKAHPARRVTLVGHTDATGGLAGNIALSRQRAGSVRAWLIAQYGVAGTQVDAQGAGYLAPRDSNLTEAGRTRNRRVEVMLTSTE